MKRHTFLPALAPAQETRVITVAGQALVDVPFDILIHPDGASPCGAYFFTTFPPPLCARVVLVVAGDTPSQVAAKIASTINGWAPCSGAGFHATAVGNQAIVTGPGPFDLALNAFGETGTCAGAPDNAPFDGLWLTGCLVSNLGNGIDCDEAAAHTGGLQLTAHDPAAVPALPLWSIAALLAGTLGLGWRVLRRHAARSRPAFTSFG